MFGRTGSLHARQTLTTELSLHPLCSSVITSLSLTVPSFSFPISSSSEAPFNVLHNLYFYSHYIIIAPHISPVLPILPLQIPLLLTHPHSHLVNYSTKEDLVLELSISSLTEAQPGSAGRKGKGIQWQIAESETAPNPIVRGLI